MSNTLYVIIGVLLLIIVFLVYKINTISAKTVTNILMRKLWSDHMWYTREYLIRFINKLPDVDVVATRLLKNQIDIANAVNTLYPGSFNTVKNLLTEHIVIATKLVDSIINNNGKDAEYSTDWSKNATSIATALASLNPKYNKVKLNDMMQQHLKTTTAEMAQLLVGKAGVNEFEIAFNHMMMFSDYLLKE